MARLSSPSKVYVDASALEDAGRGVFASSRIEARELIEQCPIVALPDAKDRDRLRKTGLVNYYFLWGDRRDHAAICLGWGSVYNHSFSPNAKYEKVLEDGRMDFMALRAIEPGEEIFVNYNGDPDNQTPLRIPGIPMSAGGMTPAKSRVLQGVARRMKILSRLISGKPAGLAMFALASAF